MKRKIFSKLLMVALVIAAVGSFVSCKDYDDDINNLQKQIDAKAAISQIEALQSQLTSAASAASAAQTTANQALEEAKKKTTDEAVKKAIDEAVAKVNAAAEEAAKETAAEIKKAADAAKAAGDDAATAQKAADEAKAAAEKAYTDAKAAIDKAIEDANLSQYMTEAQVKTLINEALADADYVTATSLKTQLDELKETIPSSENMEKITKAIASYDGAIAAMYSAVTSVELISSFAADFGGAFEEFDGFDLNFSFGKMAETAKFGDKEDNSFDANEIIEYTEGKDIRTDAAIVVRVNPTNATFTKDQVKFIDSEGNNLDEIITVGDPYRFEGLITRANIASGLWVIPVKVAEDVKKNDFNAVTFKGRTYKADGSVDKWGKQILYAVAIDNTTKAESEQVRYAASTYDLATQYVDYEPATILSYNINGKSVDEYHNRWNTDADPAIVQSKDQPSQKTALNPELAWIEPTDAQIKAGVKVPTSAVKAYKVDGKDVKNAAADATDGRYDLDMFQAEIGKTFTISLPEDLNEIVEYYYVALDYKLNAIESNPSEWNAWEEYKDDIEGLYTQTKGTEKLDITINSEKAQGDVIGFRLFAVNYDGTLVDPDGKAFYVKAGDEKTETATVTVKYTAVNGYQENAQAVSIANLANVIALGLDDNAPSKGYNSGYIELDNEFTSLAFDAEKTVIKSAGLFNQGGSVFGEYGYVQFSGVEDDDNFSSNIRTDKNATIYYALLKKDGKTLATNWKDIKYIWVAVNYLRIGNILNNATLPLIEISQKNTEDANAVTSYKLTINAQKIMPTTGMGVTWMAGLGPDDSNALTIYPKASNNELTPAGTTVANFAWGALPDGEGTVSWKANAVSCSKNIASVISAFKGVYPTFYKWTFADLPTGLNVDAVKFMPMDVNVASATSSIVTVLPAAIGNTYNTTLNYLYKGVNCEYDAANETFKAEKDFAIPTWTGTTTFANAAALVVPNFAWNTYSYAYESNGTTLSTLPAKIKTSSAYYIGWDKLDKGVYKLKFVYNNDAAARLDGVQTYASPTTNIAGLASAAGKLTTAQQQLVSNAGITDITLANGDGGSYVSVSKVEITGNAGTYIKANGTALNELTFAKVNVSGDGPTGEMAGNIKITLKDAFKKSQVVNLPITLLPAGAIPEI